ncbi:MAG: hypothetical protein ACI9EF_001720 [Pseudohongiellaceae bacterium]|jgi:hypothetical protein
MRSRLATWLTKGVVVAVIACDGPPVRYLSRLDVVQSPEQPASQQTTDFVIENSVRVRLGAGWAYTESFPASVPLALQHLSNDTEMNLSFLLPGSREAAVALSGDASWKARKLAFGVSWPSVDGPAIAWMGLNNRLVQVGAPGSESEGVDSLDSGPRLILDRRATPVSPGVESCACGAPVVVMAKVVKGSPGIGSAYSIVPVGCTCGQAEAEPEPPKVIDGLAEYWTVDGSRKIVYVAVLHPTMDIEWHYGTWEIRMHSYDGTLVGSFPVPAEGLQALSVSPNDQWLLVGRYWKRRSAAEDRVVPWFFEDPVIRERRRTARFGGFQLADLASGAVREGPEEGGWSGYSWDANGSRIVFARDSGRVLSAWNVDAGDSQVIAELFCSDKALISASFGCFAQSGDARYLVAAIDGYGPNLDSGSSRSWDYVMVLDLEDKQLFVGEAQGTGMAWAGK